MGGSIFLNFMLNFCGHGFRPEIHIFIPKFGQNSNFLIPKFDIDDYNYKDPRLHHLHTWSQHLTTQIVINRQLQLQ